MNEWELRGQSLGGAAEPSPPDAISCKGKARASSSSSSSGPFGGGPFWEASEEMSAVILGEVYVSDREGSDATGDGTQEKPFKTALRALMCVGKEPFPTIYVDSQKDDQRWETISKTQFKNVRKLWQREQQKSEAREKKEAEDLLRREKNLEEAKKIVIKKDPSLPEPKCVKIRALEAHRGERVKVFGWVHRLRRQGKNLMFIVLRDGTGYLQCVLSDELCQCYNGVILSTESTVAIYGTLNLVPEGKQAPGGHELNCDYWELIGLAPAGGADNLVNEESDVDVQLNNRHMMIRGETLSRILKVRSTVVQCFRDHFFDRGYYENFELPKRPFKRMNYTDALVWLKEHDVKKEDGNYYEFGDDIPEAPERQMTDAINEPILLCRFPAEIKSFYMQRCPEDSRLTESVDVLMPNVGEIVGGSMRIWDSDELLEGYKREGIDPTPYYWYTDQRKYGTCPHGGYGLGLERFLTWILNRHHIRDVCLYPRFVQRCKP
ncbi:hypothetical protein JD844_008354 [Phrynosoma platyrhinos]|uniref:Asparagine--tRNA ligase, cytoplasmic n=1 Tax=Phrynosoma platyrhinos TaxID=52577 RepID=A0ABQ7TEC1_PHRPL|nr:hypothetical protein JD844_008354 [Phrynosoma platyrhinos]